MSAPSVAPALKFGRPWYCVFRGIYYISRVVCTRFLALCSRYAIPGGAMVLTCCPPVHFTSLYPGTYGAVTDMLIKFKDLP